MCGELHPACELLLPREAGRPRRDPRRPPPAPSSAASGAPGGWGGGRCCPRCECAGPGDHGCRLLPPQRHSNNLKPRSPGRRRGEGDGMGGAAGALATARRRPRHRSECARPPSRSAGGGLPVLGEGVSVAYSLPPATLLPPTRVDPPYLGCSGKGGASAVGGLCVCGRGKRERVRRAPGQPQPPPTPPRHAASHPPGGERSAPRTAPAPPRRCGGAGAGAGAGGGSCFSSHDCRLLLSCPYAAVSSLEPRCRRADSGSPRRGLRALPTPREQHRGEGDRPPPELRDWQHAGCGGT